MKETTKTLVAKAILVVTGLCLLVFLGALLVKIVISAPIQSAVGVVIMLVFSAIIWAIERVKYYG